MVLIQCIMLIEITAIHKLPLGIGRYLRALLSLGIHWSFDHWSICLQATGPGICRLEGIGGGCYHNGVFNSNDVPPFPWPAQAQRICSAKVRLPATGTLILFRTIESFLVGNSNGNNLDHELSFWYALQYVPQLRFLFVSHLSLRIH